MFGIIFRKMILMKRSSGINDPQASYGTVSTTNASSFLSLIEYTDAFLWLLKFLPAEDLLHIKLLSKPYYHAFHDPEIFFLLKEFFKLTTNTDLDKLTTLFTTERNRTQKQDRFDRTFKYICCQNDCRHCILCCYMSRNIRSDYRYPSNQFIIQKCLLISLSIACVFLTVGSGILCTFFAFDKKLEHMIYTGITFISTVIAALCFTATCSAYTSCCRPLNHYCRQVSKLRVIQNDINNAKMTNTLFANKERAGFNNDSSKTSDMEEGLLSEHVAEGLHNMLS
jgi:hypothetical protein